MKALALWWSRVGALMLKELKQLSRDPVLLLVIVYFFSADIYIAGKGIEIDLKHASIAVLDHDHSEASRDLIYRFQEPYFTLRGELDSAHQARQMLDHGDVLAVLDIPADFQKDLRRGRVVTVQLQIDASNATLGILATTYATRIVASYAQELATRRMGGVQLQNIPVLLDEHRVYYNPNQKNSWFMSISEMLTVITMLSLMLPAAAAVREKERGTIEQLIVSPLSSTQILFSKVAAMGLVILSGTAVSLFLVIVPAFHVPLQGDLALFFAVTALYVFATCGLGLFIATLSRNLGQVVMLVILIMMPLLLLSGAWTPPEAMPPLLRNAMHLSPLFYYTTLSYGILLKGAGIAILWPEILQLTALGGMVFGFGVWRFRRQFG
jgi:ABC-2 type transport system permease protein